ncbi:hypothetical protein G5I_09402 [Acromyrmex echinatior]|uniref:Uncharacterized protein n=1 Tax=Acromyrmex echinatior TaxID=103372 RepID=F4WU47_ACREC|nr:hypothetical protein G5I_09402 [Acromyrmex echinatior]
MTDNRHVSATRNSLLFAAAVTVAAAVAHDGRCARRIAPATTARSSRLARCERASASRGVLLTCKPSIRVPCGEDQQVRVPDVPTHGGSPLVSHVKLFLVIPIGSTFHPMKDPLYSLNVAFNDIIELLLPLFFSENLWEKRREEREKNRRGKHRAVSTSDFIYYNYRRNTLMFLHLRQIPKSKH